VQIKNNRGKTEQRVFSNKNKDFNAIFRIEACRKLIYVK
jgi:hypothetical protein